jgi:hypothetical protein
MGQARVGRDYPRAPPNNFKYRVTPSPFIRRPKLSVGKDTVGMTDVVSGLDLARSLEGSVTLTLTLVKNLYKYFRKVQGAPAHAERLRKELHSLSNVLVTVQEVCEQTPGKLYDIHEEIMEDLRASMLELQKRITEQKTSGSQRLTYPFKQKQGEIMVSRIQRLKGDLSFILELKQTCTLLQ